MSECVRVWVDLCGYGWMCGCICVHVGVDLCMGLCAYVHVSVCG